MRQIIKRILTWLMGMIRQNALQLLYKVMKQTEEFRPKNVTAAREKIPASREKIPASREKIPASHKNVTAARDGWHKSDQAENYMLNLWPFRKLFVPLQPCVEFAGVQHETGNNYY